MEIVFLIGSVQALFLSIILFLKKNKMKADMVLLAILMIFGCLLLDNYFRNNGFYERNPEYFGITYCLPMIIGPLILFYVYLMTSSNTQIKWHHWLHSIPFVFYIIYFLATYYFLSGLEKKTFLEKEGQNPSAMIYLAESFLVFSTPVYSLISLVLLKKHAKKIKERFSFSEKINLEWLRLILISMVIVSVISLLTNLISDIIPLIDSGVGDNFIFFAITIVVFLMGYYGIKQQAIYSEITVEYARETIRKHAENISVQKNGAFQDKGKYAATGLNQEKAEGHLKELLEYMESEKPYLNGKLTQREIADALNISTNHLSQIINEKLGKNFFDFVNSYRVENVKCLLSNSAFNNYTLLAIAYDSGFNSKSSFNSIFKKQTGLTPSEFQKTLNN